MKTKISILLLLIFSLSLLLVSCSGGCESHIDENLDGACDNCGEAIEDEVGDDTEENEENEDGVAIIKDGSAVYSFVMSDELNSQVRLAVNTAVNKLAKLGIKMKILSDDAVEGAGDCEILVGYVASRGEKYAIDPHTLGPNGTAIKLVDKRIILLGGSDESMLDVVNKFIEDYMGIEKSITEIGDVVLEEDKFFEKPQTSYIVPSVAINGVDIANHVMVYDSSVSEMNKTVNSIRDSLYNCSGYWLKTVKVGSYDGKSDALLLRIVEDAGEDGFRVYIDGNSMVIESEFYDTFAEATLNFITQNIVLAQKAVDFQKKFTYTKDVRNFYYKDFGAKGDGIVNDFNAIRDCHMAANECGHIVNADNGKTYYIGKTEGQTIPVMTDVNWGNAKFIIDDSFISPWIGDASDPATRRKNPEISASIFSIKSSHSVSRLGKDTPEVSALKDGFKASEMENIGFSLGFNAMLIVYNTNHKVYIRYGGNANDGASQQELIIVDKEGNIDPTTPFLLDYDTVTDIHIYNIDDTPITISGGHFERRANQAPSAYTYYSRNINVTRSNVTFKNFKHSIIGELDHGAPYSATISASYVNNLLCDNCTFQGHKFYMNEDPSTGGPTSMGTYEIGGGFSNNLQYINCLQTNFFTDSTETTVNGKVWGVMGTNYCKNITYIDSVLNRLDAHAGVVNINIIRSYVRDVSLIGGGLAYIEGSHIYNSKFVALRSDYGSTWKGELVIKDSTLHTTSATPTVIGGASWVNHYFGYKIYVPEKVMLDNIRATSSSTIYIIEPGFAPTDVSQDTVDGVPNNNPFDPNILVTVNNCPGIEFLGSRSDWLNTRVRIIQQDD